MSLKKYSILALLPIVAGCSFIKPENKDFGSLYNAHVDSKISSLREVAKDLGYMETYQTKWAIRLAAQVPMILSGSASSEYDAKVSGQDVEFNFTNPKAYFETLMASGNIDAKSLSLIAKWGDAFFRYADMSSAGMFEDTITSVLAKYNNTWLALTEADIESTLSWTSEEDILSYKISEALTKMNLTDVEWYLKKYPLWKETKDLGMVGEFHAYEVELSRENILAMMDEFTKKATGKDMTPEAKTELQSSLNEVSLSGTLSLHPKNATIMKFVGKVATTSDESLNLNIEESEDATKIAITVAEDALVLNFSKTSDGNAMTLSISNAGNEVAKLDGTLKKEGDAIRSISMKFEAPEQGLTLTLEHTISPDGNFEGKLNAWVGTMSWKGAATKEKWLTNFKLNAAMMGSSLEMNLVPGADGLLRWPLSVKSGDTAIISAEIWLKVNAEEFTLIADVASPEEPSMKSHAEISITGKRDSWNGAIESPKESTSFQKFADDMSAAMPNTYTPESFTEDEYYPEWDDGMNIDASVWDEWAMMDLADPVEWRIMQ
jgi:hypothetical protein